MPAKIILLQSFSGNIKSALIAEKYKCHAYYQNVYKILQYSFHTKSKNLVSLLTKKVSKAAILICHKIGMYFFFLAFTRFSGTKFCQTFYESPSMKSAFELHLSKWLKYGQ